MQFPNLSLADRTNVYRVLLILASILIPLVGWINKINFPVLQEPLEFYFLFSIICISTFILSFLSSFVRLHFTIIGYFLSFILVVLFQIVLYKNSLHPVYVFETYIVFIGISLTVENLSHLKVYFFIFLISVLITTSQVENPLFPVYSFIFQIVILGLLIYILFNSFIQVQKKLITSNDNFLTLINNADELYFLIDNDYSLLKINDKGKDFVFFKYGLDIREGANINDYFSENELKFLIKYCSRSLNGETIVLERIVLFPGDVKKWYEIKFIPVNSVDLSRKVLISALDISEKKRTLDILRESEAKFRAISESSPLGIFSTDPKGNILYRNQNFINITRCSTSSDLFSHVHPADLPMIDAKWKDAFSRTKRFKETYRYIKSDGGILWTNCLAAPILEGEVLLGYVGTVEDITELKLASELVKRSEKQFRDLFQMAPIGMALARPEGKILRINQAFLETIGFEAKDVLDKYFYDFILPDDLKNKSELTVEFLLLKNSRVQLEKRFIHKVSDVVFVILTITLLKDHEGMPSYILLQIIDITDRKQSEEILEQKNLELQKINSELDAFVYSSAHDLRAPLTSILGVINLVRIENESSGLNFYLNLIEQSVKKLDGFISDIIEYSRNTRTSIKIEKIDPTEFLEECFNNLRYIDEAKNITRVIEINEHFPLYSDQRRLQIILNNLVSNAIRYHDPNKEERYIKISFTIDPQWANIVVEDNGIGIEGKYLEKVFNMFFRASESSKGSGLGLYIVKEAISKLEGKIEVESKIAVGTKFSIRLPNRLSEGERLSVH